MKVLNMQPYKLIVLILTIMLTAGMYGCTTANDSNRIAEYSPKNPNEPHVVIPLISGWVEDVEGDYDDGYEDIIEMLVMKKNHEEAGSSLELIIFDDGELSNMQEVVDDYNYSMNMRDDFKVLKSNIENVDGREWFIAEAIRDADKVVMIMASTFEMVEDTNILYHFVGASSDDKDLQEMREMISNIRIENGVN